MATVNIHARNYARFFIISLIMLFPVSQSSFAKELTLSDIEITMFGELASASSQSEGIQAESVLWEYWFNLAPTADVRQLLDQGRERREAYDYEASVSYTHLTLPTTPYV